MLALAPSRIEQVLAFLASFGTETDPTARQEFVRKIEEQDNGQRFGETIERFTRDRLTYARLCPQLAFPSLTLSPKSRQIVSKLLRESNMEDRLEMYSDRLEAMEELYEGANDRVADYRWYRGGHLLEWTIVIILIF